MNSIDLQQTSANLNRSVFFDRKNRIFYPKSGYSSLVDVALSSQFLTREHLQKVSNLCFDTCVKDFSTPSMNSEESACVNLCKAEVLPFIREMTTLTEN